MLRAPARAPLDTRWSRAPCQTTEATVDVVVTLGEEPTVTVTDVHPIALADAVRLAVEAIVTLAERLRQDDTSGN